MLQKAYLEITNRCNLACAFCHGTKRPCRDLSREEFEFLTDRLAGHIRYLYFHLLGEPLIHPDLPFFIVRAKEKGFLPMLTTNGTLLSDRAEELLSVPLHKISISLHAPEANGAFATDSYLSTCAEYAAAAAENGTVAVLRLWNIDGLAEGNGIVLERLRSLFSEPWEETRSGYRIRKNVYLEWGKKFDWPDPDLPELSDSFFCYGLRDQIGILSDGTAVPCCLDAEGNCALGNLFDTPLEEILHSPRAQAIYNGFTNHKAVEPLCRRCGYAAVTKQYHR